MTQQEFLNAIEGILNDFDAGLMDKAEAKNAMLETLLQALGPFVKAKEHLQLFIYRVHRMRELQIKFFNGNRKVVGDSKRAESQVDNALKKLCSDFGYSMEEVSKKFEQTKML